MSGDDLAAVPAGVAAQHRNGTAKDGLRALFHCYRLNYWAQSMADWADVPVFWAQFICLCVSNKGLGGKEGAAATESHFHSIHVPEDSGWYTSSPDSDREWKVCHAADTLEG